MRSSSLSYSLQSSLDWACSISNGLAVLRFLWRKDYEALDDPGFAQLAGRVRTFDICYTIFFGAILVWNLIEIFAPAFRTPYESP
jgi:hypothetical protein